MPTGLLEVAGMRCSDCTSNVVETLKGPNGVSDPNVSLAAAEATVRFDERLTSFEHLKSAVQRADYGVGSANATQCNKGKGRVLNTDHWVPAFL